MTGECGKHSVSSTLVKDDVTCEECLEYLNKKIDWTAYEYNGHTEP